VTAPSVPPPPARREGDRGFFETLRGGVLSSIPALSVLVFLIVAVKVFRASGMEATTTVAVVSSADTFALLKGVILTLLPGFLAGVTAASMWWWAGVLPTSADGLDGRVAALEALRSPQAVLAWALVVMAFFTISWPIFLALFLPLAGATYVLLRESRGRRLELTRSLRPALRAFGLAAAAVSIGYLTLTPSVWLPLRTITVAEGQTITLQDQRLPQRFAAYVLSRDDRDASLLLADPRAVIQVSSEALEPAMPLCVPPESRARPLFLRLSQVLRIDPDFHSPYEPCPDLGSRGIFGR
jgi:hypothetical protein